MTETDNTGDYNTGHDNTGDYNTGHRNTGNRNTGNRNTGHRNTGHRNTGRYNTGHRNTGHYNTGHRNTGHDNTGHDNTGDHNTGNHNTGDYNTGFFMTTTPDIVEVFNGHQVDRKAFLDSMPSWLFEVHPTKWVDIEAMTDGDKQAHPEWEATGGYVLELSVKEAYAAAWEESDRDADEVRAMPGFDHAVWVEITGINLDAEDAPPVVGGASCPDSIVINGVTYDKRAT